MIRVADFSAVLKRKMGLDSGSIGSAAIERAVRHRMQAVDSDDEQEYLARLQASPAEMQQLIEAVIVPETWFFRYPESQAAMATLARERLFAPGAEARVLRVLSVPCSSGEEPYSIAMALLDAGVPPARFQIDAVDISERMVEFARRACYGRNSFRGDNLSYRDRHFTETADGHQLADAVMARVRFLAGNLFDAHLLPNVLPYDFVFCRNLLIYFDAATQERAVALLKGFARRDGVLFVGPAETSLMTGRRLPALPLARAFAFRAEAAKPAEPAAAAWMPPAPRPLAGQVPVHASAHASARASTSVPTQMPARMQSQMSTPPQAAGARAAVPLPPASRPSPAGMPAASAGADIEAALRAIAVLADQGRVQEAMAQCRVHLAQHGASAEALYLLGLLQDAGGDTRQAQAAYRKALYLDPTHREALLHLAALVESEGDAEGARRLQARAARQEARRE
ncbi:chemotaxis protein CheR [Achromobacter deleyi]|uniref:Chemotaxis protein CheR n=1 Tax=Achromobacter deleyi TaxID=1353891 RepID=A0A7T4E1F3_9BURK|nr:protein-glutamate O-methyltransferase CheR [Achromobacter deleyi]QQB33202.1 chemotaxis protein CheR [Achromobacter deleyi]